MSKKTAFTIATCLASLVMVLVLGEVVVRLFHPQPSLMPRFEYSEQYGSVLFKNTTMVHAIPGNGELHYTINEYGYRGKAVPVSSKYDQKNIVVLGDSYAFGQGVADGQEFSAVLQNCLDTSSFRVINLAVIGYGLTQEVRRFYEFGQIYHPSIVILQFCANDPSDNLFTPVAYVRDGRILFRDTQTRAAWVKEYMSRSILQKSQLYNLFRAIAMDRIRDRTIIDARIRVEDDTTAPGAPGPEEQVYDTLLDAFARDLHARGVRLIMIAVNGQLDEFPGIRAHVQELAQKDLIEYCEVQKWFAWSKAFASPEGHSWGAVAHRIIGEHLAECVLHAPSAPADAAHSGPPVHASSPLPGIQ